MRRADRVHLTPHMHGRFRLNLDYRVRAPLAPDFGAGAKAQPPHRVEVLGAITVTYSTSAAARFAFSSDEDTGGFGGDFGRGFWGRGLASCFNDRCRAQAGVPIEAPERVDAAGVVGWQLSKDDPTPGEAIEECVKPAVAGDHRARDTKVGQRDVLTGHRGNTAAGKRNRADGVDGWVEEHERRSTVRNGCGGRASTQRGVDGSIKDNGAEHGHKDPKVV